VRFALVAGEASGDILGAALIRGLQARFPGATFYGVAGPRMREAGCEAIASIEALSVMGLTEVLRHLPRLMALRRQLTERFAADRPDLFIGIDAPDFNLGLERRLKAHGIRTAHLVSPTIWAWRPERVHGIGRAADLVLCLYPFEPALYASHGIRAAYVGHPLADELDDHVTQAAARRELGMDMGGPVLAVLPGSRGSELHYLSDPFAATAAWLHARVPGLRCLTPLARPDLRAPLERAIARHPGPAWQLLEGQSRLAMQAADVVLLASGTATLECLLLGRPMVVSYKASPVTAWLAYRLVKIPHVGLPNILAAALGEEPPVPELLQADARADRLGPEVFCLLRHAVLRERQLARFGAIRTQLRCGAGDRAAAAIKDLLG
jgi:lipid-A-disaccharide synthase